MWIPFAVTALTALASAQDPAPPGMQQTPIVATTESPAKEAPTPATRVVDLASLLDELLDPGALARLPDPPYRSKQSSSRDPASVSPGEDGWFANHDAGHYVRFEERDGRREAVMLDASGPGVVVRVWSPNPKGKLRVYVDGADTPILVEDMRALLSGRGPAPAPFAAEHAQGFVLDAPIPFASGCKITCDEPDDVYYHVGYRAYPAGTRVVSVGRAELMDAWREGARRLRTLPAAWTDRPQEASYSFTLSRTTPEGSMVCTQPESCAGPRAVSSIDLRVDALDIASALPKLFVRLSFDGVETVACPLGDFFASAPGVNPYESRFTSVRAPGDFHCRWVMPYGRSFEMRVENVGRVDDVHVSGLVQTVPWNFDDRSMYFHASWKPSGPLATRPIRDWRHLSIRGRGVLVGDALTVANPTLSWWGEGDEKIRVDGETMPSIFGTGTEDYYGFGWCDPHRFAAPLCGQTRCDGPANFGFTSLYRFRSLDAIPFEASLVFDMENWHWADATVERAATVYYYARPESFDDAPRLTARDAAERAPKLHVPRVEGALEAEDMVVSARSPDLAAERQYLDPQHGRSWSSGAHLWVRARSVGDFVELTMPCAKPGSHEVIVYPTKSYDYGRVTFSVDDRPTGVAFDGFNLDAHEPAAPVPLSLGRHELGESFRLRITVTGAHERSDPPRHYFGLDCVVVN